MCAQNESLKGLGNRLRCFWKATVKHNNCLKPQSRGREQAGQESLRALLQEMTQAPRFLPSHVSCVWSRQDQKKWKKINSFLKKLYAVWSHHFYLHVAEEKLDSWPHWAAENDGKYSLWLIGHGHPKEKVGKLERNHRKWILRETQAFSLVCLSLLIKPRTPLLADTYLHSKGETSASHSLLWPVQGPRPEDNGDVPSSSPAMIPYSSVIYELTDKVPVFHSNPVYHGEAECKASFNPQSSISFHFSYTLAYSCSSFSLKRSSWKQQEHPKHKIILSCSD